MARPGLKDICKILTLGVAARVFGLYMPLAHGAYGAVPDPDTGQSKRISRLALTLETADGKVYTYRPASSLGVVPHAPAAEGGVKPFFRNLAVGISVPLVLLGLGELFSWIKRRHNSRAAKDRARQRIRERRRLLRSIYAAQEELEALEDEIHKNPPAGTSEQEQKALSASYKARKRELLFKLDDLRYQLRDMHAGSSSKFAYADDTAGSIAATSGGDWVHDSSSRHRRVGDKQRLFGNYNADTRYAGETPNWGHAAKVKTSTSTSREDSSDLAQSPEQEEHFKSLTAQTSDRRRFKKQHRVDKLAGQNRVEVIRQLLDELPGMPPEEVLRIAEKAARPGL